MKVALSNRLYRKCSRLRAFWIQSPPA